VSEQQQQQAPKRKLSWRNLTTILRYWLKLIRARRDPTAFTQVVENLAQDGGVPPKDIPVVHHAFIAVREAAQAKQSPFVDLYLVGGMGAIDLILLPLLLSAGTSDAALSTALFLLVLSLPLTAMSLFFKFLKQKYNITTYGGIHSSLSFLALATGVGALDGAIWHVSRVAAIVFLCLATLMYVWAGFYLVFIQSALRFNALQNPPEADKPAAPDSPIS
jgi:hypothetical protein